MDSNKPAASRDGLPVPVSAPTDWGEALSGLLAARISLVRLESKTAASQAVKSGALLVLAVSGAVFGWALLLAGGIAAFAAVTSWSWYWVALTAALLHATAAAVCLWKAKSCTAPAFPITRAEFQKDREWLESLKTPRKSND